MAIIKKLNGKRAFAIKKKKFYVFFVEIFLVDKYYVQKNFNFIQ